MRPCEERRRGEPGHQEAMRVKDGQKSRVTKMAALWLLGESGPGLQKCRVEGRVCQPYTVTSKELRDAGRTWKPGPF